MSDLYAANNGYVDGRTDVVFSYTPDQGEELIPTAGSNADLEVDIDFQAYVFDLAGNVGFSDSNPGTTTEAAGMPGAEDDFQPHVFRLDRKRPALVTEMNNQFTRYDFARLRCSPVR